MIDLATDDYTKEVSFFADPETIVVFEGVFIFRKELSEFIDMKIFIEIPFEEVKKRAMLRDLPSHGPEIMRRYDEKYIPAQKKYLQNYTPSEIADIIIDNLDFENPKIIKPN